LFILTYSIILFANRAVDADAHLKGHVTLTIPDTVSVNKDFLENWSFGNRISQVVLRLMTRI